MYTSDALNWRFGKMTRRAGIGHWHAHEGRHTAVSIMSSNGASRSRRSATRSATVHPCGRDRLPARDRPAIRGGATMMDAVFGSAGDSDNGDGEPGQRYPPAIQPLMAWSVALSTLLCYTRPSSQPAHRCG